MSLTIAFKLGQWIEFKIFPEEVIGRRRRLLWLIRSSTLFARTLILTLILILVLNFVLSLCASLRPQRIILTTTSASSVLIIIHHKILICRICCTSTWGNVRIGFRFFIFSLLFILSCTVLFHLSFFFLPYLLRCLYFSYHRTKGRWPLLLQRKHCNRPLEAL